MKKIMTMLVMVFTLSTTYAFTGEEAINKQALSSFKSEFAYATDAKWTLGNNYFKVSFTMNQQQLFAFYDLKGEFMAVTRYISTFQLPINLQTELKKDYSEFWVSDLFEMADKTGTSYFITVENADTKIVLQSNDGIDWTTFKKSRKA